MRIPPILERVEDTYGGRVSPQLAPVLAEVYAQVQHEPPALPALHKALDALLTFLASPSGRTHANCVATDSFFMHVQRWERDWGELPEPYQDVLGMLGDALHDTVVAPEIADNFDNTPEQLLTRLRGIESRRPAV